LSRKWARAGIQCTKQGSNWRRLRTRNYAWLIQRHWIKKKSLRVLGTDINRGCRGTCVGVSRRTWARVKNVKTRRDVRSCESRDTYWHKPNWAKDGRMGRTYYYHLKLYTISALYNRNLPVYVILPSIVTTYTVIVRKEGKRSAYIDFRTV